MDYLAIWKILEKMIVEFRTKGIMIPDRIMSKLKASQTLINILKVDPSCENVRQKVEKLLLETEVYVVSTGQENFEISNIRKWIVLLEEASKKEEKKRGEIRFLASLPRKHRWIRIKREGFSLEKIQELTENLEVEIKDQNDYLLVSGEEENIKKLIRKMKVLTSVQKNSYQNSK